MTEIGVGMLSLQDLLSGGQGVDRDQREEDYVNRFSAEQVRAMLRDSFSILNERHKFESGQIVRPKKRTI